MLRRCNVQRKWSLTSHMFMDRTTLRTSWSSIYAASKRKSSIWCRAREVLRMMSLSIVPAMYDFFLAKLCASRIREYLTSIRTHSLILNLHAAFRTTTDLRLIDQSTPCSSIGHSKTNERQCTSQWSWRKQTACILSLLNLLCWWKGRF